VGFDLGQYFGEFAWPAACCLAGARRVGGASGPVMRSHVCAVWLRGRDSNDAEQIQRGEMEEGKDDDEKRDRLVFAGLEYLLNHA
jgi:hypothetical protein